MALLSKAPKLSIIISLLPSHINLDFPSGTDLRLFSTFEFGPIPLGYLTAAGPSYSYAVVSNFLVSSSSEGVQITIFGMHLKYAIS